MYSSSSQSGYNYRSNGTHPIECYECQLVIGETAAPFTRALCEVCQRALEGRPLSAEQITIYRQSKEKYQSVGMLVVEQEEPQAQKFSLRGLGGGLLQAVGFAKPKPKVLKSRVVSEQKRREGLFHNVNFQPEPEGTQKEEEHD